MLDVNAMFGPKMPDLYRQLTFAHRYASESIAVEITPDGRLKTAELNCPHSGVALMTEAQGFPEKLKMPVIPMLKHIMVQMNPPAKLYTYANAPPEMKADWGERADPAMQEAFHRVAGDMIRPHSADNFMLTHHPMFGGSAMMSALINHQEAGLTLANCHLSIFVVAHTYNALRQLHLLNDESDIMERVTRLQTKALFADAIPKSTVDMADRLSFRLNVYNTQKRWAKDEKWKMKDIHYDVVEDGTAKDFGLLRMCHDAFEEAKAVRGIGLYSYRTGDGEEKARKGSNTNLNDTYRHGLGLMTTGKVFKEFIATEKNDFIFPFGVINVTSLAESNTDTESDPFSEKVKKFTELKINHIASAADLNAVLAGSTYVLIVSGTSSTTQTVSCRSSSLRWWMNTGSLAFWSLLGQTQTKCVTWRFNTVNGRTNSLSTRHLSSQGICELYLSRNSSLSAYSSRLYIIALCSSLNRTTFCFLSLLFTTSDTFVCWFHERQASRC
jgi:hypothetical protein